MSDSVISLSLKAVGSSTTSTTNATASAGSTSTSFSDSSSGSAAAIMYSPWSLGQDRNGGGGGLSSSMSNGSSDASSFFLDKQMTTGFVVGGGGRWSTDEHWSPIQGGGLGESTWSSSSLKSKENIWAPVQQPGGGGGAAMDPTMDTWQILMEDDPADNGSFRTASDRPESLPSDSTDIFSPFHG